MKVSGPLLLQVRTEMHFHTRLNPTLSPPPLPASNAEFQYAHCLSAFLTAQGWQPRLIWISLGGFVFFPVLEASKMVSKATLYP